MVIWNGEEKARDPRRALGREVAALASSRSKILALRARGTLRTLKEAKVMFL